MDLNEDIEPGLDDTRCYFLPGDSRNHATPPEIGSTGTYGTPQGAVQGEVVWGDSHSIIVETPQGKMRVDRRYTG